MANGILAAIMSFIIPGLGQAYAGDIQKGIIFIVISILLAIVSWFVFNHWVLHIIGIFYSIYAAYDAYQMAQ